MYRKEINCRLVLIKAMHIQPTKQFNIIYTSTSTPCFILPTNPPHPTSAKTPPWFILACAHWIFAIPTEIGCLGHHHGRQWLCFAALLRTSQHRGPPAKPRIFYPAPSVDTLQTSYSHTKPSHKAIKMAMQLQYVSAGTRPSKFSFTLDLPPKKHTQNTHQASRKNEQLKSFEPFA